MSIMAKGLKKQVNDNICDRNFKPVNQYTKTAIEFLESSNQPISSKALSNNLEVRSRLLNINPHTEKKHGHIE